MCLPSTSRDWASSEPDAPPGSGGTAVNGRDVEEGHLPVMVEEVMTPDPVRITVDRDLPELVSLMHSRHIRRVPIVDASGMTLGIVTLDDLIALFGYEMSQLGGTISEASDRSAA